MGLLIAMCTFVMGGIICLLMDVTSEICQRIKADVKGAELPYFQINPKTGRVYYQSKTDISFMWIEQLGWVPSAAKYPFVGKEYEISDVEAKGKLPQNALETLPE